MKQLKSSLVDFYTPEDISVAKVRLLDDVRSINSTIKLPHVPQGVTEINAWRVKFMI